MSNYHFSFNRKKGVYEKRPCKAKSPNRCPFSKESVEVSSFERELHKAGLSKVSETFIKRMFDKGICVEIVDGEISEMKDSSISHLDILGKDSFPAKEENPLNYLRKKTLN